MPNASSSTARVRFLDRDQAIAALEALAAAVARRVRLERIVLFGSLARGDHSARSDADLLVIVPDSEEPPVQRAAPFLFHFADAPLPVDILVWTLREWRNRLVRSDRFALRVEREGVTLWPPSRPGQ